MLRVQECLDEGDPGWWQDRGRGEWEGNKWDDLHVTKGRQRTCMMWCRTCSNKRDGSYKMFMNLTS